MRFIRLSILVFISYTTLLAQAAYAEIWSYDSDQNNQDEWAGLDKDYAVCGSGKEQSPAQISFTQKEKLPALAFHYGDTKAKLQQKDYTLVADIEGNNTLMESGKSYKLVQLRFHSPSEHTVLERFWPVEIQLMHQDSDGKTLILSVFAETGESNAALQTLLDHVPEKTAISEISFNPQSFIPPKPGYYAYTGSLTIPPCAEGIEWRILKEPISISQKQFSGVAKITGRNARLPQPIYMRTIKETGE